MAIYGPSMINSDKGSVEFGAIVIQICDRIDASIETVVALTDAEQTISVDLEILRSLCEKYPRESSTALTKEQIERWRSEFLPWLEGRKATIPEKYCEGIVAAAASDLQTLASLAAF